MLGGAGASARRIDTGSFAHGTYLYLLYAFRAQALSGRAAAAFMLLLIGVRIGGSLLLATFALCRLRALNSALHQWKECVKAVLTRYSAPQGAFSKWRTIHYAAAVEGPPGSFMAANGEIAKAE